MTTIQGPKEHPATRPPARGECRCQECATLARKTIQNGSTRTQWGPINDAAHGTEPQPAAVHGAKHSMECQPCQREAQRLRETGVRWVSWSAVRGAVHNGVEYAPEPDIAREAPREVKPAKKRYRHIQDIELPFSFTFDQAVGFGAGLTLSLPVISVFGLTPDVGLYVAAGLTSLGAATPWFIGKARDTENRKSKTLAAPKPSRKTRLASANQDREAVLLAWALYETDVALQIDFPAMTDVRKPETAALAKALRAAEIASRHAGESIDSLIRYEDAVLDLEGAFKAAETAAKLDQENPLTVDQKALAHTLLAMAVDPGGNLHERRQAHQRLLKLLDGVIVLAQPARLALEAATTRREIDR